MAYDYRSSRQIEAEEQAALVAATFRTQSAALAETRREQQALENAAKAEAQAMKLSADTARGYLASRIKTGINIGFPDPALTQAYLERSDSPKDQFVELAHALVTSPSGGLESKPGQGLTYRGEAVTGLGDLADLLTQQLGYQPGFKGTYWLEALVAAVLTPEVTDGLSVVSHTMINSADPFPRTGLTVDDRMWLAGLDRRDVLDPFGEHATFS